MAGVGGRSICKQRRLGCMSKKLSELLKILKNDLILAYRANSASEIYFTDLSPLDLIEIKRFWPFPGSELERAIALRLATRTAQETVMAAMAWDAGKRRPCYKCGKRLHLCMCGV